MFKTSNKLAAWNIGLGMAALFIGGLFGPLQKLEHAGINLYTSLQNLGIASYYQGLTLHAVLNAIVWTTFFIIGFFTFVIPHSLKRELTNPKLNIAAFYIMVVGLVMTAVPILLNLATVLFTFYTPLMASPFFYIGLTIFVVGSWVAGWGFFATYITWRKEHPGQPVPFLAFGAVITMALWQIATLGVAVELLVFVIPWSLGWIEGTDPQMNRTLLWFFGHPLVYFWLLPAYLSWYGMVPKQVGGKLFSEPMARLVFWLFLVLSVPVGIHHQFLDPGIPQRWKLLQFGFTFALFVPSLLTAFNVIASLEIGGRNRGGTGLLGWIRALPWDDPSFTAQNLAMILFAFGGISGLANASYNMNLALHNTTWIPGHFHLTVGSAVTLTFFGIAYWLVPKLANKPLWNRKLALAQAWTWFIGMILMSNGLHALGLIFQAPRRSMLGAAPYASGEWQPLLIESLVGGLILGVSGLLFYANMIGTVTQKKQAPAPIEMPVAEPYRNDPSPAWLHTWRPWLITAAVLILVSYGPVLTYLFANMELTSPGFKLW